MRRKRGLPPTTNTNLKNTDFDVFAFTADGTAFMGKVDTEFGHDGVNIVYKDNKWDYKNAGDLRYWPTEPLGLFTRSIPERLMKPCSGVICGKPPRILKR